MSEPETIRSVTTLGAVVLGFALGQTSEWFKSRRKAKKQKKAVRRLIELETKENVSRIGHFWNATLAKKEEWKSEDGEFLYGQLADQVSRIPFPPIAVDAWHANLGEVASAYTEHELVGMWRLQRDIERLQALYAFFCEAQSERRESSRFSHAVHGHPFIGSMVSGIGFAEAVKEPAKEFKELIEGVLAFVEIRA